MIEVENLTKQYNDFTAVKNVNFKVTKGEIFGYLGQNGAGKTTTINLLVTLLSPNEGKIFIQGLDVAVHAKKIRQLIGYLPDNLGLYPTLSVYQNLDFLAILYHISKKERINRIKELLKFFKLEEKLERINRIKELLKFFKLEEKQDVKFRDLSRGMKQKLGLAKALIHDPDILFLDEPTSNLDPIATKEVLELLLNLKSQGKTIFITTHLLHQAEKICDSIALLDKGEIIIAGPISTIKQQLNLESLEDIYFKLMEGKYD